MEPKIKLGLKILMEEFKSKKDSEEFIVAKDLYPLLDIMIELLGSENDV